MPDVEKINVQDTVFFSVCVCLFLFSTGVADIKAWPWRNPEPTVTSRSRPQRRFWLGAPLSDKLSCGCHPCWQTKD